MAAASKPAWWAAKLTANKVSVRQTRERWECGGGAGRVHADEFRGRRRRRKSDGALGSQELLLVLECWISHWRVMSAER